MIQAGAQAPDFALRDHGGEKVSLSDLRSEGRVMLAFFPNDFSPICRDQFVQYEPRLDEIAAMGARIVGISVDSHWTHAAFREATGISITLLADFHPKGEVAEAYGAYIAERGHANRSLVLVEPEGTVGWVHESPTPLEIPSLDLFLQGLG